MKIFSLAEKKLVAKDVFERYPQAKKVSVTCDGQAFITDVTNHSALNHAKNNRHGKELKVDEFTRDELENDESDIEAAKLRLHAFDLDADKPDYKEMKKLIKDLCLSAPDSKAETLIVVLKAAKEELLTNKSDD